MEILINDAKLELLLEQKRDYIGNKIAWDNILSAVSFLVSVGMASYNDILFLRSDMIKGFFIIIGLYFASRSIFAAYKSHKVHYSHKELLSDIRDLNEIQHPHSIVALKDTFNTYPNRYLVYFDAGWGCYLFLNFKDNANNESFIKQGISSKLKVDINSISISYLEQLIHEKYSPTHKKVRTYRHRLYSAALKNAPSEIQSDSFIIDGVEYRWMSISEMEQDEKIKEKNSDILHFVKEYCG